VDTKLISYWLIQRGSSITELYNKIADQLWSFPKGQVYLAFDDGASDYRKAIYSEYKGHRAKLREKKSDEEILQHKKFESDYIKMIELSKSLPVKVLHSKGVEADDLISITVERLKNNPENKVYLLTGDMDYINSVVGTDNVFIINVNGGNLVCKDYVTTVYGDLLNSRERFNVHKSIFGDKSDNIKFMRGLGEVKAKELFEMIYNKYDEPTVDEIVAEVLEYVKDKKSLKIHEYHIQDGRTTVKEVLEANLCLADTFRDTSKMTEQQVKQFEDTLALPQVEYGSREDIFSKSLDLLEQPVVFNYKAERVFNVR
jgi:5'-3' exonuclease